MREKKRTEHHDRLLLSRPDGSFHLTAPSRRHRRREFRVHFAALAEEDVAEAEGIPVTSVARTHLDLAALAPDGVDKFLERSEKSKAFDLWKFDSLLDRTSHHPGHGPLQRALCAYRPELAVLRSDLERDFRTLLRCEPPCLPRGHSSGHDQRQLPGGPLVSAQP